MRTMAVMAWLSAVVGTTAAWGDDAAPRFEDHIRPLLKAHCFSCHGESAEPESGLDLRLVRLMRRGGENGPAVIPGQRDDSPLYQRLVRGEMPPEGKPRLSADEIDRIGRWIAAGALTRRPEPEAPALITDDDRAFWSFRPLERPAIPIPTDRSSPQGPVDAFILKALDDAGLPPNAPATPRTLLRRLSFVLAGLPPSSDAVEEFERDPTAQHYQAQVDRLLASPQFGERWARFWLDLVRYVDETPDYLASAKHAWRYRDWVVRALNDDLPYDEFVRRQLAADLQPGLPLEESVALGLLGLSPTYWKELRLAPAVIETVVADELDERIDTVTRTFLGLTVSCARCHHHKFDPVTTEDYYALAGIMASTQLVERPLLPAAEAEPVFVAQQQIKAWEEKLEEIKDATAPEATQLKEQIAKLRAETPLLAGPWMNIVEEASLYVLPDGDENTRLDVRRGEVRNLPVFRRGNPADPGAMVERRFLDVLSCTPTIPISTGSGRLELAESLVGDAHPLLARVIVNRVWTQVFGQGLVRTPSDFGRQGELPTHPELLEYLADRLVEERWSLKRLIRELVTSATFQQAGIVSPAARTLDPNGQLLSRMPRRRLDVEGWRDALLATAGTLDDRL
ncbi:MAG TPA: PSD1 and planctomycete cytochrome C domain-containing protein, partial [Planctomycetaceae bacterium]|nr:PSD1 and planctomycete cytochrome C domain-containing protein [Planctomycetaceae bacterium]